jgi:hypothetical protein
LSQCLNQILCGIFTLKPGDIEDFQMAIDDQNKRLRQDTN